MKLMAKLERNLALFVGAAIKLVEPEEVVRLNQADLDRLEALSKKRLARGSKTKDVFEVNIVGVKTVLDKGRMRSRAHDVCFRLIYHVGADFIFQLGIHRAHSSLTLS
jgi:hypothetical protein